MGKKILIQGHICIRKISIEIYAYALKLNKATNWQLNRGGKQAQ